MKKIMLSLCALAALVSCAKELDSAFNAVENENAAVAAAGKTIVRAGLAEAQKTYLGPASGDTRPVYWQETDAIQINGVNSTSIEIDPSNPSSANFVVGIVDYPYHAAYPAALASGFVADSVVVNLPAVQNYVEDSFDPKAAAMFAYASEGDLVFKHAMSFLKVKIGGGTNSSAIKSVRVRANINRTPGSIDWGREAMSGEFVANITSDGVVFHRLLNDASSVTLDCGDGVVQGKELYIAIPAQTYHYGINLFIVSADNQCQEIVSKKAFAAEAGKAYLTEIAYNGGMTYVGAGIYTSGDWDAFAAQCTINDACEEFKDENGEYILRNDLYAESFQRLGGITEGVKSSDFKGVLNGNGKSLYPSDQTVPLFTYISGTVKNLTVAGERKSFASTAGWGTCQFALDVLEGGLVDNCVVDFDVIAKPTANAITWYYGMFRDIKAGATVTNCVVKSDYTIDYNGVTTNDVNVLPFSYSNAGTVKDCRNEGNINFVQDPGQKAIVGCIYKNMGSLEGFVNTGNFTIKSAKGAAVAGVAVMGGGSIKNCVNGVEDSSSEYGVIDVTAIPETTALGYRVGGIACYADASSATNCGLFYADKNYGDITLTNAMTGDYFLSGSGVGGIVCFVRYGAFDSKENNTFAVFDGCENHGHLTVYEPKAYSNTGAQVALYLGGIIGYVLNANGLSSGALVLGRATTAFNGNYVVCRVNCMNQGTLEMASANSSGMGVAMSGARQNYVGGICGFAYGMGNTNTSGSSNAHYAVIRGQQDGVIKVGSAQTGNSCAGGIIGGGCYVKIDQGSVNVTYEATTLKTKNAAPKYRGACAAVAGFMLKHTNIGTDNGQTVNATMEENTGLLCSGSLQDNTSLLGYAGITGAKSVDNTTTAATHKLNIYGKPIATLNGVTITTNDIYGTGSKYIDQN